VVHYLLNQETIKMATQIENSLEFGSRKELEQLQASKLQKMLAEIYGKNKFYTNKFDEAGFDPASFSSIKDLSRLPFTRKNELVADQASTGFAANLTYPITDYVRFHQTSGTTGEPLHVLDTIDSWNWWGRCWRRVLLGAGLTTEDRIFCAFSFGPFIGFWGAVEGARQLGTLLIPGGGRSSIARLRLMLETECTALCCTPSYALHLLEVAKEHNFNISALKIHTLVLAGEPGANIPAIKKRINEGWSAQCHDHAGASEVGAFGFEPKSNPNGLSINECEFIAEVLDKNSDEPVGDGEEGELVLTNLGRWGFPIIRYRTGDVVKYSRPAEDSSEFLYLQGGIIGRADDMVTVRGVNIYPSAVDNLVREITEIDEYRATVQIKGKMGELTLEIEIHADANADDVQARLSQSVSNKLGLRPTIKLVEHNVLPRFELKGQRFHVNIDTE
jgi:phenylacetate-CoA ligase